MNPITTLAVAVLGAIAAGFILIGLPVPAIVAAVLAVFVAFLLKMANNWERFVILRAGRLHSVRGPGLFMIIPVFDQVAAVIDERILQHNTGGSEISLVTKASIPCALSI